MTDEEKPKRKKPALIEGGMLRNVQNRPTLFYRGDEPEAGETIKFRLANGVTYTGKVATAVAADGEVMCDFTGPLKT